MCGNFVKEWHTWLFLSVTTEGSTKDVMTIYYPRRETSEHRGHKHAKILNIKKLLVHLFLYMHVCICVYIQYTDTQTLLLFAEIFFVLLRVCWKKDEGLFVFKFSQGIKKKYEQSTLENVTLWSYLKQAKFKWEVSQKEHST